MSEHARPTRRRFLAGMGFATGAAVAAGYGVSVWTDGESSTTTKDARRLTPGTLDDPRLARTLVVVEMGGGNDGLATVVPLTDPAYRTLRPTLAVTDAIPLDDVIGLHPNLPSLAARYQAGRVAIVEGLGYPEPNMSHFASLATWWSASPGESGASGWLGRYLDGTVGFDDPLAGVAVGPMPSPALLGARSFATSITDTTGLAPSMPEWVDDVDDLIGAWSRFAPASPDPATVLGRVQRAIELTARGRRDLQSDLVADGGGATGPSDGLGTDAGHPATVNGAREYRRSASVTDSLRLAAQLVASEHPPRVVYVSGLGDFDTHQGQAQRHPALMADLDAGIETFFAALDGARATDRALLMTVSEFGRRPGENGGGTDHGTAAPHLVVGSRVRGGRYGESPSLTAFDHHGCLVHTTDFRSLYATALQGWLGVEAEAIIGKGFEPLPLLH